MADTVTDVENEEIQPDATNQSDVLNMSDEDFMNASESDLAGEDSPYDKGDEESGVVVDSDENKNEDEDNDQSLGDDENDEDEEEVNEDGEEESADSEELEQTESEEESDGDQPTSDTSNDEGEIDYKAEYEKLFAPILSSGRTIKMRNVDHVRNYVQMGDNYNKKMHDFKPYMNPLRTLKDKGIIGDGVSDDKLNFLIELDQKNPEAIKRLIAESGLDIYELQDESKYSPEESKKYQPANMIISDEEMAIEEALETIKETETFSKTVDIMRNKLDQKSQDMLSENPSYIISLNDDIAGGRFDVIMEEANYLRDMKQLPPNLSTLEAYIATVNLLTQQADTQEQPPTKKVTRKLKNESSRKKKVGMGTSSSRPAKKKKTQDINYFEMSDEEFAKLDTGVL